MGVHEQPGHDHADPWLIPVVGCVECARIEIVYAPAERPPILTAQLDGWPALMDRVLVRDARCIYADTGPIIRIGASVLRGLADHFCRDREGRPIPWHRIRASARDLHRHGAIELDHVKEEPAMAIKAPDDEAHLVVACHGAHHGGLSTSELGREFSRRWLASLYPAVWAVTIARRGWPVDTVDNSGQNGLAERRSGQ